MSITIVPQSLRRLLGIKNCPSEQELAAYAEKQLMGAERNMVEKHLAWCDACMHQVSFLIKGGSIVPEEVPAEILRAALTVGAGGAGRDSGGWRWAAVGASAAVLLTISIAGFWHRTPVADRPDSAATTITELRHTETIPSLNEERTSDESKLRGTAELSESVVVAPKPGESLRLGEIEFRWKPAKDARFYELQVMSEAGDVIWQERTTAVELKLPASVALGKGNSYYVWLRVHTARGPVEQTKAIRFSVE